MLYSYSLLTSCHACGWEDDVFSYSYLNVLFKVNNIHINLCCRSSEYTIYSMYKQEKYVNKKLDLQKKKSVHIVHNNANTVRSHVAQLMTLTKFIFQLLALHKQYMHICIIQLELTSYHACCNCSPCSFTQFCCKLSVIHTYN